MTPKLRDDGHEVTLDLHGATVDEAERLIRSTAALAAARGRSRLTVVHGTSTSSRLYRNRTIRHALYELLDGGALPEVTSEFRSEGSCLLGLDAAADRDERRLSLSDIRRR
jgi:DNA-nicking Smr family endonuclease